MRYGPCRRQGLVLMLAAAAMIAAISPAARAGHDKPIQKHAAIGIHIGDGGLGIHISAQRRTHIPAPRKIPAPVIRHTQVACTPGHYELRTVRVLVEPARTERRWVPPVHEMRRDRFGRHYSVCVREGYWQEVHIPARYEQRTERIWVAGSCTVSHHRHDHLRGVRHGHHRHR